MLFTRRRVVAACVLGCMLAYALYFFTRAPVQDAAWSSPYQVIPQVRIYDDTLSITNLRDFRYDDNGAVTQARYIDREYPLSGLRDVWFGLSHFGPNGLAHAFASFEFSNGEFLVVSIEARLREDQVHYRPVTGALRGYTKFVVLATEQDVVGLRSHIRKEPVYLYRLQGSMLQGRALLLNYMRRAETLSAHPEFYNTLTDNCLTGLLAESGRYTSLHHWLDYRILLPGYSDALLLEKGFIGLDQQEVFSGDMDGYLQAVRIQAHIDPEKTSLDAPDFSTKIRAR
jgi:uncharacterized protein DUF4105